MLVAVQLSVLGCLCRRITKARFCPAQTITSLPVHTTVCPVRAFGALIVLVAIQLSVLGLYLPPVSAGPCPRPRQSFHYPSRLPYDPSASRRVGSADFVQLLVPDCISRRCSRSRYPLRPRRSFRCHSRRPCETSAVARWRSLSSHPCSDCISRPCSNTNRILPTPDDHLTTGPHCRVKPSSSGRVCSALSLPNCRSSDCISPQYLRPHSHHHAHPRRSFYYRSRQPCDQREQLARRWCWWLPNCPYWDCICRRC